MAYAQTRVSCTGYNANYTPNVEARNPLITPNSSKLALLLTILKACKLHSNSGTSCSLISQGSSITAAAIVNVCNAINAELQRRGLSQTSFEKPLANNICYPKIISAINTAVYNMRAYSYTNPVTGYIMTASNDPNPAITLLNKLVSECVCYTDCRGYSVCYCYSYCNNY